MRPTLAEAAQLDAEEASQRAAARAAREAGRRRVTAMEPVFRTLEIAAKALVTATGTRITYQHIERIPRTGGAVIAINHTSYVDWLPAALAVHAAGGASAT